MLALRKFICQKAVEGEQQVRFSPNEYYSPAEYLQFLLTSFYDFFEVDTGEVKPYKLVETKAKLV